uniref:DNA repair protein XRCC2 isoform X2 n=1 Tax=Callithrix jacchus TaxID=9483 RepID=UPI00159E6EB4|nr:DNA repair protein XRCC2 isoform X2 [Callithrix jacchus]
MCSDFHRAESGTELLARLEGRSSLKEIEPSLFADEDSPVHALQRNDILSCATTWMNLEDTVLSEIGQKQKDKLLDSTYMQFLR